MKLLILTIAALIAHPSYALPHMDLEMSSEEYRKILRTEKFGEKDDEAIVVALNLGERLSEWIAKINTGRTAPTAIRLTSPTTRSGIPIDQPNIYSPAIIKTDTENILKNLPTEMKTVLTGTGDLPDTTSLDDKTFIEAARKLDRNYQSAARFKSVDRYRSEYARRASKDIRGYYYLTRNKITEVELRDVSLIPADKLEDIKQALILICRNSDGAMAICKNQVTSAFNSNTVAAFYKNYIGVAKRNWDDFFRIPSYGKRKDVIWSGTTMTVPFNTPSIAKFGSYLRDNIEDEYHWNDFQLRLNFGSYANGPTLEFEAGALPHVNGLGGNQIIMDSNQPIEEYESQWIIRHEFGHVIGLPDCYHEFYDTSLKAYVNYQLDTTDLMCSRAGNMKERIYKELKKTYGQE